MMVQEGKKFVFTREHWYEWFGFWVRREYVALRGPIPKGYWCVRIEPQWEYHLFVHWSLFYAVKGAYLLWDTWIWFWYQKAAWHFIEQDSEYCWDGDEKVYYQWPRLALHVEEGARIPRLWFLHLFIRK